MSGVPESDPVRVDVDLDAFRPARLGVELDVGEAAPRNQQCVTLFQSFLRRFRTEQTYAADGELAVIWKRAFSKKRLHNRRAKPLRHIGQLIASMDSPTPREDTNLLAIVQYFGRDLQNGRRLAYTRFPPVSET